MKILREIKMYVIRDECNLIKTFNTRIHKFNFISYVYLLYVQINILNLHTPQWKSKTKQTK